MSAVQLLTAPFVGELATSVTSLTETLVGPGIRSRADRRVIDAQDRAGAAALERRRAEIAEEQRAAESDVERHRRRIETDIARHRELSMDARYPLGQPGKLRELLPGGVAPWLLVSPTHRAGRAEPLKIADIVADVVRQIDSSGQLLRVVSGAFAHDDGKPREIDGNVGASEIALFEFNPRPSIIVRFEGTGAALTAHAHLTHLIRTVDDEARLETPVARVAGKALEFATWRDPEVEPGAHLTWQKESISDSEGWDALTAFGTAIALFAVSVSSVYWRLQGVRWRITGPSLAPLNEMFQATAELVPPTQADSDLTERLNQELAELTAAHMDVEVLDLEDDDSVGVHVPRPPRAVTFVVGRNYPTEPPRVLVSEADGGIQEVRLDASQWEPSHSLADLLGAFA